MKKTIDTENAPKALGPYSQGIVNDNFCFVSMQLGIDPKTGKLVSSDIESQAEQVMKNVENILKKAKFSLTDTVKSTLYITSLDDFAAVNKVYAEYFIHKPARSLVVQAAMPQDAKVALDVIAYRIEDKTENLDYQTR